MEIDTTLETALSTYLPVRLDERPFVTLTYAQLLDARIAAEPGTRTRISHAQTKAMTHYIRHKHDAILVGIGTVLADDPKLNCRYGSKSAIKPVVLDPSAKWEYSKSQLRNVVDSGEGLAPLILIDSNTIPSTSETETLESTGGKYVRIAIAQNEADIVWDSIYASLWQEGIGSVMVEGGARVINDLLVLGKYDSLIITVGPVFLGDKGVAVAPQKAEDDLQMVSWWTGIQDSVLMAKRSWNQLHTN